MLFFISVQLFQYQLSHPIVHDHGHLLPVRMKAIKTSDNQTKLLQIVEEAKKKNIPISIAGLQHSQGGHTLYPNGILLDMKQYNQILEFDKGKKRIKVQSGATWADIQSYINPYGLALKVSQSQNIFTVGGSLSVNVHGRDIRTTSLIETIESFRLLDANGKIIDVSRTKNPELFKLVIGGYGLFGVILDVTIELTNDELYQIETKSLAYDEYTDYFTKKVLANKDMKMHLARISVAPNGYLKDMYVTNYMKTSNQSSLSEYSSLKHEDIIAIPKLFLGLSRLSGSGKDMLWDSQKIYHKQIDDTYISRNNVMRSESVFMEYDSTSKTEVLQEYFIPINEFTPYIDDLRETLQEEDLNLLNITIRYVKKNNEAVLSYAKEDMFALVLLINQGTDEESIQKTGDVIRKMIEITLNHGGSYYLPYYQFPTNNQLEEAYPRAQEFFEMKEKYDSDNRFLNLFYEEYHK